MSMSLFATMEDYYKHRTAELEKQNAELLEALESFEGAFTEFDPHYKSHRDRMRKEVIKARALIAKHRGQS